MPEIQIERSALVMIEFVNEWIAPDGKLRPLMKDHAQFEHSIEAGKQALAAGRAAGMKIIHVSLPLSPDYREFGNTTFGLRGAIQKAGTWKNTGTGWQFNRDFLPLPNEFVVAGRVGASAFANSNLDSFLRANRIEHVYLTGYATHVCVESTLRDAHDRGVDATVISDATAAFTENQYRHVLENVIHHFGYQTTIDGFIKTTLSKIADGAASTPIDGK